VTGLPCAGKMGPRLLRNKVTIPWEKPGALGRHSLLFVGLSRCCCLWGLFRRLWGTLHLLHWLQITQNHVNRNTWGLDCRAWLTLWVLSVWLPGPLQ
jgi:hypothetical protein